MCVRLADEALKSELSGETAATSRQAPGLVSEWDGKSVRRSRNDDASQNGRRAGASRGVSEPPAVGPPDRSTTSTFKEAASALRVSDDTLHRMRQGGEIVMFKAGSPWRVLASEVIRLRQQPKFKNR